MYVKRYVAVFAVITLLIGVGACIEEDRKPAASENVLSAQPKVVEPQQQGEVIVSYGDKELTARQIEFLQAGANDELIRKIADWWVELQLLDEEARRRGIYKREIAMFRAHVQVQKIHADMLRQETADAVVISDEDISQYYEQRKKIDSRLKVLPKFTFSHIVVKSIEQAREIRTKIEGGADINELAKQLSLAPDAKNGGKVTGMAQNMVQMRYGSALVNSLKEASAGDIIGPVGGQKGTFEVARLDSKTEEQIKPFEEVKDTIRKTMENEAKGRALEELLESLREKAAGQIRRSARIADNEATEKKQ